jgi:hypothetical protein
MSRKQKGDVETSFRVSRRIPLTSRVGQAIAFDELAVRGPLLLELRKRRGVRHCAAGLELMDMNVYQVSLPYFPPGE